MQGLEKFKEYMSGFRSHYVVIGGLATVLNLEDRNLPARATKDVDMIIICQPEAKQYMKRFWEFIKAGGYKLWKPDDLEDTHPCFYRFVKPENRAFPAQIELFSKVPEYVEVPEDVHIVHIPMEGYTSSFSAIIMDEAYYEFAISHSEIVGDIRILKPEALIVLKAVAYMENLRRKEKGGDVQLDAKEDPRCLLADWLVEETELCYAPEVFNEINRDDNLARMQETTIFVTGAFMQAVVDAEKMKVVAAELKNILPGKTDNAVSDRKEVASSIVAGIRYFITYDEDVLKKKAEIEDRYDLQIYTPQEFLLKIDELLHREEYAPSLLQGVALHTVTRQDATRLQANVDKFQRKGQQERKTDFENVVMGCLNHGGEMYTVSHQDEEIAFYGWSDKQNARVIHFLRVAEGPLCSSLLCQIVTDRLRECVAKKRKQLVMEERYLTEEQRGTLLRLGFKSGDGGTYVKYIRSEIVDNSAFDIRNKEDGVRIEMTYYPLKIRDLDIPCYIIPIKAVWAGHLFDHVISSENLFGADPSKLWSFENVYYRHKKPITEEQPARILWYVCDRKEGGAHSKMIVASSYLTEVHTGKGQELYRRFKHYGIYEWSDIYALCGREKDEDIRALKFSHTELFSSPIGFANAREILGHYGYGKWTFQSPLKVPKEAFFEFYERGMV